MSSIKQKFDSALEKSVTIFLVLCIAIGIGLTVTGYVFSQQSVLCLKSRPVIDLNDWLLGFSVVSTLTVLYAVWFILNMNMIQIDLGFVVHIVAAGILALFFFIYHWFAYDGLFGDHGCVRNATWGFTLAVVICQLAAIPGALVFVAISRILSKFSEELASNAGGAGETDSKTIQL